MKQDYQFTLDVRVTDPEQLLAAARAHPDAAGMPTEDFYCDDGEIDIDKCLIMVLDPGTLAGCTIYGSRAEAIEEF